MIKVRVPELLKQHGLSAADLMRKANLAYGTALKLSKGRGKGMSFEVLNSLCELFDVEAGEILEYIPSKDK
ncbi:MAG: helix-turn-helix transcriptional regulator [Chloroflexi bacterium]|nr:helix-turn-helix transcriptional regulator [Chloroflexota bacterium]